MTESGLSDRLGITRSEAKDLFLQYHTAYPRIRDWSAKIIKQSKQDGYVETHFGRKVVIWEYESDNWRRRQDGERTAGNAPVQGGGADYVKISMVRAKQALRKAGIADKVRLVLNVHDALEWYVHKSLAPADVIKVLLPAVQWAVEGWPAMLAEWHIGTSWGGARELELLPDGSVRLKKKAEEKDVEVTGDEDEEEDVPLVAAVVVAPAVRAAPQVAPVATLLPPVPDSSQPRTVVVSASSMPSKEVAQRFHSALKETPGRNTVILKTPEGDITVPGTFGLSPDHEPEISVLLGGALVYYDIDSVDMAALGEGLEP